MAPGAPGTFWCFFTYSFGLPSGLVDHLSPGVFPARPGVEATARSCFFSTRFWAPRIRWAGLGERPVRAVGWWTVPQHLLTGFAYMWFIT